MRRGLIVGVLAVALSGCSGGSGDEPVLVVYSAGPRPLAESITTAFTAETGTRVELFTGTTGQVMARLEAERYRPRADVVIFASQLAAEALRTAGRLLPYPDPSWLPHTHREWHDPQYNYFATSAAIVGMAFRAQSFDPTVDWDDVLGRCLSARFTMPSPSRSGAAADFVLAYTLARGEAAFDDFARARRCGLQFAAANSQAIGTLLVGAHDGMLAAVDYLIYRQIAQGAPLVMHYPASGAALVTRPIAILASTPKAELGKRFVDFYFSEFAQTQVAGEHLLPARTDIALSSTRADALPKALFELDMTAALAAQRHILRRFQIEIERAAVPRNGP